MHIPFKNRHILALHTYVPKIILPPSKQKSDIQSEKKKGTTGWLVRKEPQTEANNQNILHPLNHSASYPGK